MTTLASECPRCRLNAIFVLASRHVLWRTIPRSVLFRPPGREPEITDAIIRQLADLHRRGH